jgi:hypothetical protein
MSTDSGRLSLQVEFHRRFWWPQVPLEINGVVTYNMVIDSGTGFSCIGESMRDLLLKKGLTKLEGQDKSGNDIYLLTNLKIQGQSIPDLRMRFSSRVTEVGAYGLLGIDFLYKFKEIHFYRQSRQLILIS